jgi:hypothetical protein
MERQGSPPVNSGGPQASAVLADDPKLGAKEMSGQWGDRPLGRGDGGYSNLKSVWFFRPFCCAREQQDDTQEQTSHNRGVTPENPKPLPITRIACSPSDSPSIARPVHSFQYFMLSSRPPFWYGSTSEEALCQRCRITLSRWSINSRNFSRSSLEREERAWASDSTRRWRPS